MNNQQFPSPPPLSHLLPQISLLPFVFSPWGCSPSSLGPGLNPDFSACSLSSVNPGSLQGSDELSPTAAVLSNADPRSAVEWKARMPLTAALAGAPGNPCAKGAQRQRGSPHFLGQAHWRGSSKGTLEFLGVSSNDTQNIFNKMKLWAHSFSNRHTTRTSPLYTVPLSRVDRPTKIKVLIL